MRGVINVWESAGISFGPRQANLVLIAYASSEGSGEPAHPRSLARTFAPRLYKQWIKRNLQTESQVPGPSEWLGMRSWNLSWRNARRHKFAWRGSFEGVRDHNLFPHSPSPIMFDSQQKFFVFVLCYKNLSWVWGGTSSYQTVIPRNGLLYPHQTTMIYSFWFNVGVAINESPSYRYWKLTSYVTSQWHQLPMSWRQSYVTYTTNVLPTRFSFLGHLSLHIIKFSL